MKCTDFDYELPPERIAQEPAARREDARLCVWDRARRERHHSRIGELGRWLRPGDLLVTNDTRVLAARLHGRRASGGRVELLLVEEDTHTPGRWTALVRPAKKLAVGERIALEDGALSALCLRRPQADGPEWELALEEADGRPAGAEAVDRHGQLPLPPYVDRSTPDAERDAADRERYQTVWARRPGAVAAPTAGLHFSEELLAELAAAGIERTSLTLHVGPGTFRPMQAEDIEEHRMHTERFELGQDCVDAIEAARARGGRVVAVGTTVVRTLESCAEADGSLRAQRGSTDLFLRPGYRFRAVDALLTNFHLPRSTLLVLVSAFAGRQDTLALYREAVEQRYRFYSFGDAMLLL